MYGKFNVISIDFKMPTVKYIFLTSLECIVNFNLFHFFYLSQTNLYDLILGSSIAPTPCERELISTTQLGALSRFEPDRRQSILGRVEPWRITKVVWNLEKCLLISNVGTSVVLNRLI